MQPLTNISSYVPYIIAISVCITTLTVAIVVSRAVTINTTGLILKITSIILAAATLFFYAVVLLVVTILSPQTNHLWTMAVCYLITGVLPAAFIYHKGSAYSNNTFQFPSPEKNITNEETTNDQ